MRVVPISEALKMDNKELVPSVKGRVTEISDRQSGNKDGKEWSFQRLKIKDQTGEMAVKIWDHEALPKTLRGQDIYISCKAGEKGLSGIYVKDDTYRDKTTKLLNVTASAAINEPGDDGDTGPQTSPEPTPAAAAPAPAPAAKPAAAPVAAPTNGSNGHGNGNPTAEVKKTLNRLANLYLHCLHAGAYVRKQWETGDVVMTEDQFQACVSTLYIQATKSGLDGITPGGLFSDK